MDEFTISGILTAIYNLGTSSFKDQLSKITIEGINARLESVIVNPSPNCSLNIFALLSQNISSIEFKRFASEVGIEFYTKYQTDLSNWKGDLDPFESFKKQIESLILQKYPEDVDSFDAKLDAVFKKIVNGDLSGLNDLYTDE